MYLVFIILFLFIAFLNKLFFHKYVNYLTIFLGIWIIISLLSLINPFKLHAINTTVYYYILIFIISFELFSLYFLRMKSYHISKEKNIDYDLVKLILIICCIIVLPLTFKGLKIFLNTHSFNSIRNSYLNYEILSGKMYLLITNLLYPLVEVCGHLLIVSSIKNQKIKKSLIWYFVFIFERIIFSGGRGFVFNFVFAIFICIFLLRNEIQFSKKFKSNLKRISILLFIFLFIITNQRKLSGGGLLYNVYVYFVGGIQLLSEYVNNPSLYLLNTMPLNGSILFSGILYPIIFLLNQFGFKFSAGFYVVNEVTSRFIPISSYSILNNGGSLIYYALRDFGVIGIGIYSIFLSYILASSYRNMKKNKDVYNLTKFIYVFIQMIFCLNYYTFGITSILMFFVYLKLISMIRVRKEF